MLRQDQIFLAESIIVIFLFYAAPYRPSILDGFNTGPTSIRVRWDSQVKEGTSAFTVSHNILYDYNVRQLQTNVSTMSVELVGLKVFTTYSISVAGYNGRVTGERRYTRVQTGEAGE